MRTSDRLCYTERANVGAGAAGLGVVYGKGVPEEGIEDRVYRLHHNTGQSRTDWFAWVRYLPKDFQPFCLIQPEHAVLTYS